MKESNELVPCPVPGCKKRHRRGLMMCFPHWRKVPKKLQLEVYAAFNHGQLAANYPDVRTRAIAAAGRLHRSTRMTATALQPETAEAWDGGGVSLCRIPLAQVHESPDNPRKHFDQAKLQELAESMKAGQITPCVVRPRKKGGYELAAGHRRYRAAKLAGLETLLCIVRELDDVRFLEVLVIENDQREDVHPLEEAAGYGSLMKSAGYDVDKIALRVGRSTKYVYDRIKLLKLIKPAQELFLENRFTASHAILLARLSVKDQEKALGVGNGHRTKIDGLFTREYADTMFDRGGREERTKAVSVAEFELWIDEHCRFKPQEVDLPNLFPDTAQVLAAAVEVADKVVPITYNHVLNPELKDKKERTFGPLSWKRADGEEQYDVRAGRMAKSKTCAYSVVGYIAVGPGRGESFRVCVNKDTCQTHWGKKPKKKSHAADGVDDWQARQRRQNEEIARQQKVENAAKARWQKAIPAISEAIAAKVKSLPSGSAGQLADMILGNIRGGRGGTGNASPAIPRGRSADDFVRHAAFLILNYQLRDSWDGHRTFPKVAKAFGVDVTKILDQVAPIEKPAPAKKAPKKKAPARK